ARTSGENLFVVLLISAPLSQKLEPPANPARFSTHEHAEALASHYNAKLCCFVQGPEAAFGGGRHAAKIAERYSRYDANVTMSPYLTRYIHALAADAVEIPLGPSKLAYYPSDKLQRNTRAIAACIREADLKGTGRLAANLIMAQKAGFEIHLFGEPKGWDIMRGAKCHGPLIPSQISKLFSQVGYYLDCSHMEGLGLLPLEAAFTGCIPVVAQELGLQGIIENGKNAIVLPSEFPGVEFYRQLLENPMEELRRTAPALRDIVSVEAAVDRFIDALALKPVPNEVTKLIPALDQHSPSLIEERDFYRAKLEQIYRSKSWFLTKPVRFSGRLLAKARRFIG
ncbi:hypothetical protein, partial [Mesorhizobium sp. RMAD-H1]|uniref:hypothetical protein n=1 Tax=Mesorhizobium sp. RMAD-H1 TaxID=2587065 RepID=UPI00161D7899